MTEGAGKTTNKKRIPFCPLMSAGLEGDRVCNQENCAWWMQSAKSCAVYVIAHNNILDIKTKQGK